MIPDVLWIVESDGGGDVGDPRTLADSVIASQRMRVASPAAFLAAIGLNQAAASLQSADDVHFASRLTPRTAVFSKILGTADSQLHFDLHEKLLDNLLANGTRVIVDVCDNYFLGPAAEHLRRMISKATVVVANSAVTADLIQENTSVQAEVIGDPVETRRGDSHLPAPSRRLVDVLRRRHQRPENPVNLLWYGGPLRSFESLHKWFPALSSLSRQHPIILNLVSAPFPEILQAANEINGSGTPDFRVTFSAWTRQCLQSALLRSDLVLLPGDSRDQSKTGASANRLIDAIWAGRYVVASGIPSYWEFRHAASIGDDVIANMSWALKHPRQVQKRIDVGQSIIREKYSPEVIGHAWWSVLKAPE
jgi:hypothetical protein